MLIFVTLLLAAPSSAGADDPPKGEVTKQTFATSKIFPGTTRDYWIYVPAQYDPAKPACVYVNQDGIQYNGPEVFDRLIATGEMPVTIGVFVQPGRVPAVREDALDRFNRSFEYDGLSDGYARFLLEELLPDVETKTTNDGRPIRLSKSGNDRAIGGASSGAICAFTAAWERPDAFTRVFSSIGTYVGLRGGNDYPTWIRKIEPKPIRVFLEDGENDLNIYGGDWWMANQEMERALSFAGYEVEHAWGTGGHDTKHATEVFPDAMRFLWRDWPEPVKAGKGSQQLQDVVVDGEGWETACERDAGVGQLKPVPGGAIRFSTEIETVVCELRLDGTIRELVRQPQGIPSFCSNAEGDLIWTHPNSDVVESLRPDGTKLERKEPIRGADLLADSEGTLFATVGGSMLGQSFGGIAVLKPGRPVRVVEVKPGPMRSLAGSCLTLSPDHSLLYVSRGTQSGEDEMIWSFQRDSEGLPAFGQAFFRAETLSRPYFRITGMAVDRDGRVYAASSVGVQVFDLAGRVNAILPVPGGRALGLAFGGAALDTLYVSTGKEVVKRKLKVRGAPSFLPASKPKVPRL